MAEKSKLQLNESQIKAINHKKGPLLVVAGAGTGKTRVITERIKRLIDTEGVKSNEILALTFTEKAANEMVERIGDVMPLGYETPWVCTFHSFADRLLKTEGLEIGYDLNYKILTEPERWVMLRKNLFKLELTYFRPLGNPTKFISAILKFISRLKDEHISNVEFEGFVKNKYATYEDVEEKKRWEELAYIYNQYEEMKVKDSRLDFGDLITCAIELFQKRPHVLKRYQEQFKHVLVDEFQDTNYAQYELIKLICPNKMGDRSLVVVGDDSQSIYKFRGAAVSNILQFMKDYPDAEMVTLLNNYRSDQKILDPAYVLIQNNNPDTLESQLGISKKLTAQLKEKDVNPEIVQLATLEDEVEFVIAKIYEILGKEPLYTFKDIAILARANSHLDPFVLGLRRYGLPYQLVGNRGLYDREEIRDVTALLKVIINPKDSLNLYRVLNIKTLEIPYEETANMLSKSRFQRKDLWDVVKSSEEEHVKSLYEKLIEMQKNVTKTSPSKFTYEAVTSINYLSQFLEQETVENNLCIKNMDIFLKKVQSFELSFREDTKEAPTIIDFIDYLDLMIEAGENPAQAEIEDIDTINLMTVHASKGLEFGAVFMINLVSDRFPTRNRSDIIELPEELIKETLPTGDEHLQEERRLFYVGMTRAKKYLYMTLAKDYGGKKDKIPSGYLNETQLEINFRTAESFKEDKIQTSLFGVESGFKEPAATKIDNLIPSPLSYSQIDKYLTCPLAFKYSYILRIPTMPNHSLSFGNSIHKTLKEFHARESFKEEVTLEELLSIFEKNWDPLGYLDADHEKIRFESGKDLLIRYYTKNKDNKVKHLGLEKEVWLNIGGNKFKGVIDRIDDLGNNEVEIIDYKTGTEKSQKDVDKDMQISIYAIGAQEFLKVKPKKLSLYFVETGEKITTTRDKEQLDKTKEEVTEVVQDMKKGDFKATPGMHCAYCSYREICPFAFKGTGQ